MRRNYDGLIALAALHTKVRNSTLEIIRHHPGLCVEMREDEAEANSDLLAQTEQRAQA